MNFYVRTKKRSAKEKKMYVKVSMFEVELLGEEREKPKKGNECYQKNTSWI